MFIWRNTFKVRPDRADDHLALVKGEVNNAQANHRARVMTSVFGKFDRAVLEIRFADLAEMQAFWDRWAALPTTPKFWEEVTPISVAGGGIEWWEIYQPLAAPVHSKIVNRRTFLVKPGKYEEALKLLVDNRAEGSYAYDILRPVFGPNDTVAVDFYFDSVIQHEEVFGEWAGTESAGRFFEKWLPLVEGGGTNEIWEVR